MRYRWNINLNQKLFGLVGIGTVLVAVLVGMGISSYSHIEKSNRVKDDVRKIVEKILTTRAAEKTYLQYYLPELKKRFDSMADDVDTHLNIFKQKRIDKAWMDPIETIEKEFNQYRVLLTQLVEIHNRHAALKLEMLAPVAQSEKLLSNLIYGLQDKEVEAAVNRESMSVENINALSEMQDFRVILFRMQALQLQFLVTGDEKFVEQYKVLASEDTTRYLSVVEEYARKSGDASAIEAATSINRSLGLFLQSIDLSKQLYGEESEKSRLIDDSGARMMSEAETLLSQIGQSVTLQKNRSAGFVLALVSAGTLLFWSLSFILVRSITRPIGKVIRGLTGSAEQVTSTSGLVADASQYLAEGASEQAAAIEETSSSIEEMSSRTRQNAENTHHVNLLMNEANEIIGTATEAMKRLSVSMEEIAGASNETRRIIKTIDEIAFQTNLLALNAAVEAARAGEVGAGFAVVADEVRNLAMRAAEAARNTANLIETTVKKVKDGVEMAEKTESAFSRESDIIAKMGEIVGEIAEASDEQSQGIEQINRAVGEMDRVVQQNAAHAEQSASASKEMTDQAWQLRGFVAELVAVLEGRAVVAEKRDEGLQPVPERQAENRCISVD